jgi:hypothetical protein
MSKLFALLAVLLIVSGVLVLAVPKVQAPPPAERGLGPQSIPVPTLIDQARDLAEQVNAPLSIFFGVLSLYYTRRTYLINRERTERDRSGLGA